MSQDFVTIGLGVVIFTGSVFNPVPFDEVVGVPLGLALVANGAEGNSVAETLNKIV